MRTQLDDGIFLAMFAVDRGSIRAIGRGPPHPSDKDERLESEDHETGDQTAGNDPEQAILPFAAKVAITSTSSAAAGSAHYAIFRRKRQNQKQSTSPIMTTAQWIAMREFIDRVSKTLQKKS